MARWRGNTVGPNGRIAHVAVSEASVSSATVVHVNSTDDPKLSLSLPHLEGEEVLGIQVMAMPKDTNAHGTIFGGWILSLIDQAGVVAVVAAGVVNIVTVSIREVVFHHPVRVGDLVSCWSRVIKRGRTSITVGVRVVAHTPDNGSGGMLPGRQVTEAEIVYVQIDDQGRPLPLPSV